MIPQNHPKAKKSLGQNFLVDKPAISAVIHGLGVKKTDILVEIGPGHGELTKELLLLEPKKLIAIEKDRELAHRLGHFAATTGEKLEIIEGDALDVLTKLVKELDSYKLIGNIPYYITGFLLRTIGELKNKPETIVLTIQKEVAERIASRPPEMNLLSASVQVWGEAEIIGLIDRESFDPVPKVDSAIIKITPFRAKVGNLDAYYKTIKILFKQPRKTILNNLKDAVKNSELDGSILSKILENQPVDPALRAQNLEVADIKKLSLYFKVKN